MLLYSLFFLHLSYNSQCSDVSAIVAEVHPERSRVRTAEVVAPQPQNTIIGDY